MKEISNIEARKLRGIAIISKGDLPTIIDEEHFVVPSQSGNGKYNVSHFDGWQCDCPDFKTRGIKCKHIHAIEFFLKMRNSAEVEDFPIDDIASELVCPNCKGTNILKAGQRKNKSGVKQKLYCKDCKKYFVQEPVKYVKANTKILTLTLDLYYKGLSLRDISDTIYQFYGLRTHHETIRRWINRFTATINDFAEKQKAQTGTVFNTDEQCLKSNGKILFAFNTIDKKTRYLLASTISKNRSLKETRKHFKEVKKQLAENPNYIITDKWHSYNRAIKKEFKSIHPRYKNQIGTRHISIVGKRKQVNNNVIERYHNDFREFDKTRRTFKNIKAIQNYLNGHKIYHNFIHENPTIKTTPAKAAGIDLRLSRNKWESLLEQTLKQN